MKRLMVIGALTLLAALVFATWIPIYSEPEPELYTESGHVTSLALSPDGAVWAGTKGGVIRFSPGEKKPEQWTTARGLSGNEVLMLACENGTVWAGNANSLNEIGPDGEVGNITGSFQGQEIRCLTAYGGRLRVGTSVGVFVNSGSGFSPELKADVRRFVPGDGCLWVITDRRLIRLPGGESWDLPDKEGNITGWTVLGDRLYLATSLGFRSFYNGKWEEIAIPGSGGASHVGTIAGDGEVLVVGLYGDGLYSFKNGSWSKFKRTPESFRFVSAALAGNDGVIIGTRDDGVWEKTRSGWRKLPMPPSLPSADIYGIVVYKGALWVSTFDHGLLCLNGNRCIRITGKDGLSTDYPRDLVEFNGALYVRHTTGEVDMLKDGRWRPAYDKKDLPRREVYAMAADGRRLYFGLWGGWASTDGKGWELHFKDPEIEGEVVTAIGASNGTVWIGTQKRGLFAWKDGGYTCYHEAHGLTDDWITRIRPCGDRLLIGTYNGGLLEFTGGRFRRIMDSEDFAVRDICLLKDRGTILVATPLGVYRESRDEWRLINPSLYGGLETQALFPVPGGVWVGSRTSLSFLRLDI
ncbi:MAG: hypothetical protein M1269_13840 [Chloroflexi bacterium]|nr:hypothetical protein [Chloroflexota bacterium]